MKPTPLPELSESQIKTEILRRFPGDALSAAVLTYLAEQVETDTQPHDLLRKVLDRIPERLEDLNRAKALVKEAKRAV